MPDSSPALNLLRRSIAKLATRFERPGSRSVDDMLQAFFKAFMAYAPQRLEERIAPHRGNLPRAHAHQILERMKLETIEEILSLATLDALTAPPLGAPLPHIEIQQPTGLVLQANDADIDLDHDPKRSHRGDDEWTAWIWHAEPKSPGAGKWQAERDTRKPIDATWANQIYAGHNLFEREVPWPFGIMLRHGVKKKFQGRLRTQLLAVMGPKVQEIAQDFPLAVTVRQPSGESREERSARRRADFEPALKSLNWSLHDWANAAVVNHSTVDRIINGRTKRLWAATSGKLYGALERALRVKCSLDLLPQFEEWTFQPALDGKRSKRSVRPKKPQQTPQKASGKRP